MAKMLRSRKQFGRCKVEGHGQREWCEACDDIQGTQFTRAQDKREWKREASKELNSMAKIKKIDLLFQMVKLSEIGSSALVKKEHKLFAQSIRKDRDIRQYSTELKISRTDKKLIFG